MEIQLVEGQNLVRARKRHTCCQKGQPYHPCVGTGYIEAGEMYVDNGAGYEYFERVRLCMKCHNTFSAKKGEGTI